MSEKKAKSGTLIGEILELNKFGEDEESLEIARTGMHSLFRRVLESNDDFT